ncbi:MAG: glycosyltransferase family 9 protein [Myxococcales bacterium]|jgi:ADP-heptose:LPS heptosyltransferase|nr:glycosyltransferase family 9 protein [Myxococcales bacterium]
MIAFFRSLGRALLLGLVRLIYRSSPGGSIDASKLKKVLVIRVDPRVGDVLLTTPLLRALRQGLPGARVDLLLAAGKEPLVEGLADRLIPFKKQDFFRHPRRFWRLIRSLKKEGYDAVIEAAHWHAFSFTSSWLTQATDASIRIGHDRGLAAHFLTHAVVKDERNAREVPSKLELLGPLGLATAGEEMETTVERGADVEPALTALRALAGDRPWAAINVGARKAECRWSPEGFGKLAARLDAELNLAPIILWGPGEERLAEATLVASGDRAKLAPPTKLAELVAAFRHSALAVANDTGPMHLAIATGAKVVAVLTLETGARWIPAQSDHFQGVGVDGVGDTSAEAIERVFQACAALVANSTGRRDAMVDS